jgi:hypothetical protein
LPVPLRGVPGPGAVRPQRTLLREREGLGESGRFLPPASRRLRGNRLDRVGRTGRGPCSRRAFGGSSNSSGLRTKSPPRFWTNKAPSLGAQHETLSEGRHAFEPQTLNPLRQDGSASSLRSSGSGSMPRIARKSNGTAPACGLYDNGYSTGPATRAAPS